MWILVVWPPRDPQWSTGGFRGLVSHRPNPSEPEGPSGPVSPSSRDLMNLALPESSMTGQRRVGQTGALANTGGGVLGEPPYPATGCSHMHNLLSEAHRAGPTICGSKGPKRATERTGGLEGMWRMTPRREGGDWPHQSSSEPGKSAGTETTPTRAKDTPPRTGTAASTRQGDQARNTVRRTRGQPRKEPPMLSTPNSPTGETLPRGPGNHRAPSQLCPAQTPGNDGDAGDAASPLVWQ